MPTSTSLFTTPLQEAVAQSGYSERQLRRLKDTGKLRAAKHRGRLMFAAADIEALAVPRAVSLEHIHERIVADLVAQAPALSEARRARIAAALASATQGGAS